MPVSDQLKILIYNFLIFHYSPQLFIKIITNFQKTDDYKFTIQIWGSQNFKGIA